MIACDVTAVYQASRKRLLALNSRFLIDRLVSCIRGIGGVGRPILTERLAMHRRRDPRDRYPGLSSGLPTASLIRDCSLAVTTLEQDGPPRPRWRETSVAGRRVSRPGPPAWAGR